VTNGKPLHHGFTKLQLHFSTMHTSLVHAGEESGTLPEMLTQLADYMEEKNSLQRALRSAAIYPIMVLIVSTILIAVFIGFIIPTFATMYQDAQTALPWATQIAMDSAHLLREILPWLGMILAVLWGLVMLIKRSSDPALQRWHLYLSERLLAMPLIGRVFQKAALARWAQSASVMLGAGLVLTHVLPIALSSTQRFAYHNATLSLNNTLLSGLSLSQAMAGKPLLFDSVSQQMVAVGEETGALSELLAKLAGLYASEVKEAIEYTQKLIQPALILFLGLVISAVLLALYLPIFQMGQMV
jgi:type IV pilus assembly protein PilC